MEFSKMLRDKAVVLQIQDLEENHRSRLAEIEKENAELKGQLMEKQVANNFLQSRLMDQAHQVAIFELEVGGYKEDAFQARENASILVRRLAEVEAENAKLQAVSAAMHEAQNKQSETELQLNQLKRSLSGLHQQLESAEHARNDTEARLREASAALEVTRANFDVERKDLLAKIDNLQGNLMDKEVVNRQLQMELAQKNAALAEHRSHEQERQAQQDSVLEQLSKSLSQLRADFESERAQEHQRHQEELAAKEGQSLDMTLKLLDEQKKTAALEEKVHQLMLMQEESARTSHQPSVDIQRRLAELQEEVEQLKNGKQAVAENLLKKQKDQLEKRIEELSEQVLLVAKVAVSQRTAPASRPLSCVPETSNESSPHSSPIARNQATSRDPTPTATATAIEAEAEAEAPADGEDRKPAQTSGHSKHSAAVPESGKQKPGRASGRSKQAANATVPEGGKRKQTRASGRSSPPATGDADKENSDPSDSIKDERPAKVQKVAKGRQKSNPQYSSPDSPPTKLSSQIPSPDSPSQKHSSPNKDKASPPAGQQQADAGHEAVHTTRPANDGEAKHCSGPQLDDTSHSDRQGEAGPAGQEASSAGRQGAAGGRSTFASDFVSSAGAVPTHSERLVKSRDERQEDVSKKAQVASILSSIYVPPVSRKRLKDASGRPSSAGLPSVLGSGFRLPNLRRL